MADHQARVIETTTKILKQVDEDKKMRGSRLTLKVGPFTSDVSIAEMRPHEAMSSLAEAGERANAAAASSGIDATAPQLPVKRAVERDEESGGSTGSKPPPKRARIAKPRPTKGFFQQMGIEQRKEIKELKQKLADKETVIWNMNTRQRADNIRMTAATDTAQTRVKELEEQLRDVRSKSTSVMLNAMESEVKEQLGGMRAQWAKMGAPPKTADHGVDTGVQTDHTGVDEKEESMGKAIEADLGSAMSCNILEKMAKVEDAIKALRASQNEEQAFVSNARRGMARSMQESNEA